MNGQRVVTVPLFFHIYSTNRSNRITFHILFPATNAMFLFLLLFICDFYL